MNTIISAVLTSRSKTLLTGDGTREWVGHRTGERRWRSSKGSNGRWRATKRREGVVEIYCPRARRRWGNLTLLQLGGFWSVVTDVRRGGGIGVRCLGVLWLILHCLAFVLFALYAPHLLTLEKEHTTRRYYFSVNRGRGWDGIDGGAEGHIGLLTTT